MARELSEERELSAEARAFLVTVGNAARQAVRGEARPMPAGAPTPVEAKPSPEAPPSAPQIDLNELLRRQRERERAARIEQLWRQNAASPVLMDFGGGPTW
jgi:hypothetical protein